MNVLERAQAPTPKFFRVLRGVGFVLAAIGGALMAAPITLPGVIFTIASYMTVVGGVISAVSQVTVEDSFKETKNVQNE